MKSPKLRTVKLNTVAAYLECNPEKLSIALQHLAAVSSGIWCSKDVAVCVMPGVRYIAPVALTPEEVEKAAASATVDAAWHVMAKEAMDKVLLDASYSLDEAGGNSNYSIDEVVAEALVKRAAAQEARRARRRQIQEACDAENEDKLNLVPSTEAAKWLN